MGVKGNTASYGMGSGGGVMSAILAVSRQDFRPDRQKVEWMRGLAEKGIEVIGRTRPVNDPSLEVLAGVVSDSRSEAEDSARVSRMAKRCSGGIRMLSEEGWG